MCAVCDGYADALAADSPARIAALLDRARRAEADGELEWLDGDGELRDWQDGQPLPGPGSPRRLRWLCRSCSRMFLLELHSRHTLGDGWRPLFGN
jgi:hypothetical protein